MQQAHETSSTSITSMDTSEPEIPYIDPNHSDYLSNLIPPCNSQTTDTCQTKLCDSLNSTPGLICGPFDCSTPNRGVTKLPQYPDMSSIGKMSNKYMYCHLQVSKTIKDDKGYNNEEEESRHQYVKC